MPLYVYTGVFCFFGWFLFTLFLFCCRHKLDFPPAFPRGGFIFVVLLERMTAWYFYTGLFIWNKEKKV